MKKLFTILYGLLIVLSVSAQELSESEQLEQRIGVLENTNEILSKLKVSGYIQGQYQWGQQHASLKVGTGNENPNKSFSRIGIRRGRIKFTYDASLLMQGVFQLDITEKGVGFKDAYINIKDPWINTLQLRAGIFDRPFGNEISYSSSRRESPERSALFQTLFPDERDLGAMVILQPSKSSPWNPLKLETGLFAGNGIKSETDSKLDFIGHLSYVKPIRNISFGAGVSYYNGSVYQGSSKIYTMEGDRFVENDNESNIGGYAKREYFGFDLQFTALTRAGMTQLRGEYISGQQPGSTSSSKSPNSDVRPTYDTYIRSFSGSYIILIQDFGTTPFSAILKYDVYDPNTKISGNQVGNGDGTNKTDLAQHTMGYGLLWRINSALRLQAFYENVKNETSVKVNGYETVRKADLFTLRLQYKF